MDKKAPIRNDVEAPAAPARSPFTAFLLVSVFGAVLSSIQFGYNGAVVNQAQTVMINCTNAKTLALGLSSCVSMDNWALGLFVGFFLVGGAIGGLLGAWPASIYGRKNFLMANNLFFFMGGACISLSSNYIVMCAGRLFLGIGAGASSAVVPLYIAEISPVSIRGILGSCTQLAIVCGSISSSLIGSLWATPEHWRLMFAFTWVPAILQLALLPFCVETPKWLVLQRRFEDADLALRKLRNSINVEEELQSIADDLGVSRTGSLERANNASESSDRISLLALFTTPSLRLPLISAVGLQLAQQLSGICAAIYYSTKMFMKLYDHETAIKLFIPLTLNNLFVILATMFWIDRFGRRSLLLIGMGTMAVSAILTSVLTHIDNVPPYMLVIMVNVFVTGFGVGMGTVPWLIVPEIFPIRAVASASTVCVVTNWTASFLVTLLTPVLYEALGFDIFGIFGVFLVLFFAFTYFVVPETSNRKVNELVEN